MDVFFTLLVKLLPLYLIIGLGYIAGRFLKIQKETLASILVYILAPAIVFHGVVTTKLTPGILTLPFVFLFISSVLSLFVYWISKRFWNDTTRNILAFTAGSGNTGYFGLPVAIAIFGESVTGIVALIVLGIVLYENTVGFFVTARGRHTANESLLKIIRLPTVYAFILGLLVHVFGFKTNQLYMDTISYFRGAYTILGMMIIGVGLSGITRVAFDAVFILIAFFNKFLIWPIFIGGVVFLDMFVFHWYTPEIYRVMMLLSIVPLAANTVSYAALLKAQPEKAALAVLLSTFLALILIPAAAPLILLIGK
jgi:malate permease and related proteins